VSLPEYWGSVPVVANFFLWHKQLLVELVGVVLIKRISSGGEALFSKANQNIGDKVQSHIVVAFRRHVFWFSVTSGRSIIELIVLR